MLVTKQLLLFKSIFLVIITYKKCENFESMKVLILFGKIYIKLNP